MKKLLILLLLAAGAGGGAWWYWQNGSTSTTRFRTVAVERGDLLATINATGTVEPEEVVDVGAQVAGLLTSLGQDPRDPKRSIDYSSPVEEGTILARIDDSLYRSQVDQAQALVDQAQAQVEQAQAQVELAQANIVRAEADLKQTQAKQSQTERDWNRAQVMERTKGVISGLDFDTAEAAYKTARAMVAVGEATISQARAGLLDAKAAVSKARGGLADSRANLKRAEINLGYCTIKSPVKGVIVDRRINVGQTVVSSLNSPSLFLIAKDLRRLQVWASVNEADVGNIHSGQVVSFTVDAFPGKVFKGVVAPDQPRLNANMTQNVVNYTVVVNTDNSDGKLLPYLTANLQFEVDRHTSVLLVPNAALRWRPRPQQVAPEARAAFVQAARRQGGGPGEPALEKDRQDRGTLWIEDSGFVRPVPVRVGLTDGVRTEVTGDLNEADAVVMGESRSGDDHGTTNPFVPQAFGGKKQ